MNHWYHPECKQGGPNRCPELHDKLHRLDGNVYCAHRTSAYALNSAFKEASLYKYTGGRRGHVVKDALASMESAYFDKNKLIVVLDGDAKSNSFTRRTGRDPVTGERKYDVA